MKLNNEGKSYSQVSCISEKTQITCKSKMLINLSWFYLLSNLSFYELCTNLLDNKNILLSLVIPYLFRDLLMKFSLQGPQWKFCHYLQRH